MDVQTMLAMIIGMVSRPVRIVLTMTIARTVMLVTVVNVADVVMVVVVDEEAGEHSHRGGVSHAHGWTQRKYEAHGPNEDHAAPA
jgi:hypothetical protein